MCRFGVCDGACGHILFHLSAMKMKKQGISNVQTRDVTNKRLDI